MSGRRIPPIDDNKALIVDRALETKKAPKPSTIVDISIDSILSKQLLALERVTKQLVFRSTSGEMTRDEIQSLATCIKITLDLKSGEKDLLDSLSDEELEEAVK